MRPELHPDPRPTPSESPETQERTPGTSRVSYARAAGLGYLVIIVTAIFAKFVVRSRVIVLSSRRSL
jgi:hypothetical protein